MDKKASKSFIKDIHSLIGYVRETGQSDPQIAVIKMMIAILSGYKDPQIIYNVGLSAIPITEIVTSPNSSNYQMIAQVPADKINLMLKKLLNTSSLNPNFLGILYESLSSGQRKSGLVYTPPLIIDFILEQTVALCNILQNPFIKIIDPSCGCGFFLLKAYDILFEKYRLSRVQLTENWPNYDWSDDNIHYHILQYNLWGVDSDNLACDITAACLLLKKKSINHHQISLNIINCDSLLKKPADGYTIANNWQSLRFDYVIGNPPYISSGLRGAQNLTEKYRSYLRENYSYSAEYKISYYALFLQRGIELLKPNGYLGFIVPDSFLLGRYFSKIRNFILQTTTINKFVHIANTVFRNASTGYSVICFLSRKFEEDTRNNNLVAISQCTEVDNLSSSQISCQYAQSYFTQMPHQRFRIFFSVDAKNIVDHMDHISKPLYSYATGHTGIRSKTQQTDIIANSMPSNANTWKPGLISGGQINRYYLEYQGHWINICSEALYKGGWSETIIRQRKILIRQTGFSLIACIDEHGYYHLNNIHSMLNHDNSITLDYLLLLLNSKLFSFYYHITTLEHGRAMAQTDIETLELLPIRLNPVIITDSQQLVRTMQELVQRCANGDNDSVERIRIFEEYLNQIIYRIYELSDEQIQFIEDYEQALLRKPYYIKNRFKSL